MRKKLNVGSWAIDTKKDIPVTLCEMLNYELCIVCNDDTEEYYITNQEHLIPYDKYYWSRKNNAQNKQGEYRID